LSDAPIIASFDLATQTGVCWGRAKGDTPTTATWDMRDIWPRPARFLWFFGMCADFFDENQVDEVWYEAPLALAVMNKIGATEETVALLRGLAAVLELGAMRAGIRADKIQTYAVQDARQHLTGQRRHGRSKSGASLGKAEVMRVAKMLGVDCANENESDAFCGWSYACALANPRIAHLVTPLFQPQS